MFKFSAEFDIFKTFLEQLVSHECYDPVKAELRIDTSAYKSLEVTAASSDRVVATTIACPLTSFNGTAAPMRIDPTELYEIFRSIKGLAWGQRVNVTYDSTQPDILSIELGKFLIVYRMPEEDLLQSGLKLPSSKDYLQAMAVVDAEAPVTLLTIANQADLYMWVEYDKTKRTLRVYAGEQDLSEINNTSTGNGTRAIHLTREAVAGTKELRMNQDITEPCVSMFTPAAVLRALEGLKAYQGNELHSKGGIVQLSIGNMCPCMIEYASNGCTIKSHVAPRIVD